MDKAIRNAIESLVAEHQGMPRQFFMIKPEENKVTVAGTREPNKELGHPSRPIPVWILESRAEVNRIIRELKEARDRAFPPSTNELENALSDVLWEAYTAGDPDCILTTREGRDEVIERILALVSSQ